MDRGRPDLFRLSIVWVSLYHFVVLETVDWATLKGWRALNISMTRLPSVNIFTIAEPKFETFTIYTNNHRFKQAAYQSTRKKTIDFPLFASC